MTPQSSQADENAFLNELDTKLWNAADRLRHSLDAAVYKHAVLGLIFLKYISDTFEQRREALAAQFRDPDHDYYLDPEDYPDDHQQALELELEEIDYYLEKNVFWVPPLARWQVLSQNAALAPNTQIPVPHSGGESYTFRSPARLIDDALEEVEKENPKLKGVIEKNRYVRLDLPNDSLRGLINLFSQTHFTQPERNGKRLDLHAKDILGHVYEYFLGQFALAEGKKGGQYFTPKAIVSLIVSMLEPYKGRVYDPAMGSGGFFVQSERFLSEHGGKLGNISVYGQESNPTTWRLAAMNMVIRGIEFNFGKQPANSFTDDQHQDLRADIVMANPPFNIKEWWSEDLVDDKRWVYGIPPKTNANFAWLQHMLFHLNDTGSMGLLLANGSMSTSTKGEGDIRRALVEDDLVECMVALPGQLFTNTQIPACIWFLTKNKKAHSAFRDRTGKVLFIDAREQGYMKDRVLRDFSAVDLERISGAFHKWRRGEGYQDQPGLCKSVGLDEIRAHDFVLTPGRYVEAVEVEDDGEPFADKMDRLTKELAVQFEKGRKLESNIQDVLKEMGH